MARPCASKLNPLVFTETTEYDFETLNTRIRHVAFLNRNIRLNLRDERGDEPVSRSYCYEGGIIEYVRLSESEQDGIAR